MNVTLHPALQTTTSPSGQVAYANSFLAALNLADQAKSDASSASAPTSSPATTQASAADLLSTPGLGWKMTDAATTGKSLSVVPAAQRLTAEANQLSAGI